MAHPINSAEFLPLTDRPANNRVRRLATVDYRDSQLLRKATPAEVAQARLFEDILQAEVAELEQLACRLTGSLEGQPELDSHQVGWGLPRIRERIEEVHHLLSALHTRFPRPR